MAILPTADAGSNNSVLIAKVDMRVTKIPRHFYLELSRSMPDHIIGLKLMRAPRDFRTLCFGLRHFLAAAASICRFASASLSQRMGEGQGAGSPNQSIPWAQLGVNATAQYSGDGLGVIATPLGAQLRCVLQKLEGEVTVDGLSLSSTVPETRDQLQVTARMASMKLQHIIL